jgi:WhiB family transcriptional regulator, redox-sensing transcriptional regulator
VSPVRTPTEGVLVAAPTTLALLDLDPFEAERAGVELPCRVQDPELWFAETPADLELAKSYCLDCPVRRACLSGALERHEPWGVWGGQLILNGRILANKRRRGRPPKTPRPEDQLPVIPIPERLRDTVGAAVGAA